MERVIGKVGLLSILFLSSCSVGYELRCRQFQNDGLVQGTIGSCVQCVQQFGSGNPEMINGCALGLDAASLVKARP